MSHTRDESRLRIYHVTYQHTRSYTHQLGILHILCTYATAHFSGNSSSIANSISIDTYTSSSISIGTVTSTDTSTGTGTSTLHILRTYATVHFSGSSSSIANSISIDTYTSSSISIGTVTSTDTSTALVVLI